MILSQSDKDRFFAKVDKVSSPLGCWLWTGGLSAKRYGHMSIRGRLVRAHLLSVLIVGRVPPAGMFVLHKCDVPRCVNPNHLFFGTQADNVKDMIEKGRDRKATGDRSGSRLHPERLTRGDSHWARKHPEKVLRGETNGSAKLSNFEARVIKRLIKLGLSFADIARRFDVSSGLISHIAKGRSWRHV